MSQRIVCILLATKSVDFLFSSRLLQPNYTKIADNCNLWRNYDDINDSWQSVLGIIQHYAAVQDKIQPFAGPGHWNDPDMVRSGVMLWINDVIIVDV